MRKTTIMIVEDESHVEQNIYDCLTKSGYQVSDIFATGEQAIEQIKIKPPDLIIMDIALKGKMNGIDTARQLQTISDIPVIFLTAFSNRELIEKAKQTNVYTYLVKPFKDTDLLSNVEIALNRHQVSLNQATTAAAERERLENKISVTKQALSTAKAAREVFMNNLSHELRNPLNGIVGMTELALSTELTEQQLEFLEIIQRSAQLLNQLIEDALDLCWQDSQSFKILNQEFLLCNAINDLMAMMGVQSNQKGLYLRHHIATNVPKKMMGDETRFRQILIKLIGNAIKFTPKGTIDVDFRVVESQTDTAHLMCRVKDTGIGIPADFHDYIFGKFTKVDESSTRQFQGPGLGLATVKSLLEHMNGSIEVSSTEGQGSVFTFLIPLQDQK